MSARILVPAVALLALAACDNDPGKGKPQARASAPAEVASTTTPSEAGARYVFSSAAGSKIAFVGAKVTRKHDGSFGTFDGNVRFVDGDVEKSSVSVDIDTASIIADDPKLNGHLKTPDFFDVAKFPKARFSSTSIKNGGAGGATHTVTGNLELHGVTKSITFPATIRTNGEQIDVAAEFAINRKDFALVYPGLPDDLIKDEVLIKLDVHAKKG